ncbi:MAG: IclR family transcriptional regulator C-terminal domain-containing protein [Rhodospirillales bacterium]
MAELVAASSFSKTTTHRVLSLLQEVRYVVQDPEDRSYRLGTALADVARQADLVDLASVAQRPMRRLAEVSGDTVFFSIPEGAASVCIARELGSYPVRTLTLERGDRAPIGVGGSALAIYCLLSDARRAACNELNAQWIREYDITLDQLEEARAYFLREGYAFNRGMVYPETSAIGLPVIAPDGGLVGGLAIGAVYSRMSLDRIDSLLLPALRREAETLGARLRRQPGEAGR